MICTNCYKDDGFDQDLTSLPVRTVVKLCSVWLCDECMDEREAIDVAMSATPPAAAIAKGEGHD